METALLQRNLLEERKAFYIDELVESFKLQHINNENTATLVKMIDSYRAKLSDSKEYSVYDDFIRNSRGQIQAIIDSKISNYNMVTRTQLYIPLIDLGSKEFLPYCYRDDVSLEEVVSIYLMASPKIFNCSFVDEYKNLLIDCTFVKEFYFLLDLLKSGVERGKLQYSNSLLTYRDFFLQYHIVIDSIEGWLKTEGIIDETFFNNEMIKSIRLKYNSNNIDSGDQNLIAQVEKIKNDVYNQPDEKIDSRKQRKLNNILKLVYYMAEDKYGHEPGEEQVTAKKLETLSDNSAQTIKGWLEDAAFLIQDDK